MSRLLFAAARGARVQSRAFSQWETVPLSESLSDNVWNVEQRIHPDDDHLQYGTISSALIEKASHPDDGKQFGHDEVPYMDISPYFQAEDWIDWKITTKLEQSLFLLILAESLADEGM